MGVIYKATCMITGKSYIGQTRRTLEQRKKEHQKSNDSYYFHRAMRKYGKDNFIWSILEQCDNNNLNERQCFWINKYNTYNNGYNSTIGGDNADALNKWRKNNSQQVLKNALNGLKYANKYRQQHKEESLKQLALAREKGINKVKKKVQCIEMKIVFQSLSDAQRWSVSENNPNGKKASHQHISKVCKGKRDTCGGYHWRYV